MKKIYHLSTCNTCQRIIAELGGADEFDLQDIKSEPLTSEQLDRLRGQVGSYEDLFNRRARKYRSLGLDSQSLTEEDYRRLILEEYTFLKRPVVVIDDAVFVGNAKKTVAAAREKLKSA
jgi:arsenate reductase-like glutaredoxin family protein